MKTCDCKASCQYINTQRQRGRETEKEGEVHKEQHGLVCRLRSIICRELPTLSLCGRQSPCRHTVRHHLSGLALGLRRSFLCGPDWILWRISGIYGDKQTVYFPVCCCCCWKLNLVVPLLISALPAWILTRAGSVGRKATEGGYYE